MKLVLISKGLYKILTENLHYNGCYGDRGMFQNIKQNHNTFQKRRQVHVRGGGGGDTKGDSERPPHRKSCAQDFIKQQSRRKRLSSLTLMCIERDVLEELELDDVIQEFVKLKLRKKYFDLRPGPIIEDIRPYKLEATSQEEIVEIEAVEKILLICSISELLKEGQLFGRM
ncbi:hypothetical protein NQ317_007195 [Molorchus minor]|uniref:Uncharacterized protein n=1 Tax=Molorchus minor TaxID=1323400 RepID=A0ABQ9ITK4_9CUCU|nr:hypothetical protein NQ317_007195 [Molorchus minor]